ncbi:MAG: polysaccharide deacetylase family protein [Chloroflexi bacterium]|nr:polysaccharide deacetylase family protein [Chloroflexota bacterium]
MNFSPLLNHLGFDQNDRAVIIHTDDIGVSAASVAAARELWGAGIISSSATMVPCTWFPAAAALCREIPHIDMGVHLTLTCEWSSMRWGPISTRDPRSGLMDSEGYMYRTSRDAQAHADPAAAIAEMEAQIRTALDAGIDVTHIDTHMGTSFHPTLLPAYVELGSKYKIPAMVPRLDENGLRRWGFGDEAVQMLRMLAELEEDGAVLFDHIVGMPLDKPENRVEQVCAALDSLPSGLSYFIIHPQHDTPEARAMGRDYPSRAADCAAFMDERVRGHIRNTGLKVIGMRDLMNMVRE